MLVDSVQCYTTPIKINEWVVLLRRLEPEIHSRRLAEEYAEGLVDAASAMKGDYSISSSAIECNSYSADCSDLVLKLVAMTDEQRCAVAQKVLDDHQSA